MKVITKVLKSVIAVALLTTFIGCSSTDTEKKRPKNLINVIEHFGSYGVKVEKMQELYSEFLFAEEAVALQIDQKGIGFYRFDPNFSKAKKKLDAIKERGFMYIQAQKCDAKVNGNFVMIYYDKHPRGKEFVKIFESFESE